MSGCAADRQELVDVGLCRCKARHHADQHFVVCDFFRHIAWNKPVVELCAFSVAASADALGRMAKTSLADVGHARRALLSEPKPARSRSAMALAWLARPSQRSSCK